MLSEHERSQVLLLPLPWQRGMSVLGHDFATLEPEPRPVDEIALSSLVITPEASDIQKLVRSAFETLLRIAEGSRQGEEPEILDLRPLSRRRVTARIRRTGPARFYLVAPDSELEVED